MQSLTLYTRVGKDGILKLEMPIGITDAELEVLLVFTPTTGKTAEDWLPSFFERTFGSIPDFPDRAPQGEYETRNTLE